MSDFNNEGLAQAAKSATVKALTGDPGTDIYARQGLVGWAKLSDVTTKHPEWVAYLDGFEGPKQDVR